MSHSPTSSKALAAKLHTGLKRIHPEPKCELDHKNAFELLVATILSAQSTDKRVNQVTPALFKAYPTPAKMAQATPEVIEPYIQTVGIYRQKAKSIVKLAQQLEAKFHGEVPEALEDLIDLPGVWRKTANVIRGEWFGLPGIIVDTHMKRLSQRMGLTTSDTPDQIEQDLMQLLPEEEWTAFSQRMILHGRQICSARKPDCTACDLQTDCPQINIK